MTGAIETPFWQNATGAHAGLPKDIALLADQG